MGIGKRETDFTPVWIDMRAVFPPGAPQTVRGAVRWELQANCVNAVWTNEVQMASTNLYSIADAAERYALRARFLGDAIPAESFAAGANPLNARSGIAYISLMGECMDNVGKWPRTDQQEGLLWHHSDWKNLAYCFVYRLFDKIKANDGGSNGGSQ